MKSVMHISEILAETFKARPTPENLTAWVDGTLVDVKQPMLFCDEVKTEFPVGSGAGYA